MSKTGFDFLGFATITLNTLKASSCKFLDLSVIKVIMSFKFSGELIYIFINALLDLITINDANSLVLCLFVT